MALVKIGTSTDTRAIERLNKEYAKGVNELENLAKASRGVTGQKRKWEEMADPVKKVDRQFANLALNVKKFGLSEEDAAKAAERLQRRLDRVHDSGKRSFGSEAIMSLTQYAAGFFSIGAAAAALLSTLTKIRDVQREAAAAQEANVPARAKLVQLAGGDAAKRKQLNAAADAIFREGFVDSRDAAQALTFELESAGRLGDRAFFSRLALIDDAPALAKSAGLIAAGFQGGDSVGSSQDIVSKAIAGALPATGVSPVDIAEGSATAAASAKSFGLTDEELIAGVSRIAQTTGSGSEAGTRMRRLLSALARQGVADKMSGQGLQAIIGSVSGQNMSTEELTKYLGSVEAVQAYDILRDSAGFGQRLSEIQAAQSGNLAGQTIENALQDESIRTSIFARRGRARNVLTKEQMAADESRAQYVIDTQEARRREAGQWEADIGWERWMSEQRRGWGGNEAFLRDYYNMSGDDEIKMLLRESNDIARQNQSGRQE